MPAGQTEWELQAVRVWLASDMYVSAGQGPHTRAEVRVGDLELAVTRQERAWVPASAAAAHHSVLRLCGAVERAAHAFCAAGLHRLAESGYELVESFAGRVHDLEGAVAEVAAGLPAWPGQPSQRNDD